MNITTEDLKTLYERAEQYSIAKFGKNFERLHIGERGVLELRWSGYERGDDDNLEYVEPEDLTQDLDILVAERKAKEEQERIRKAELDEIAKQKHAAWEKSNRKAQYLKLKQEFENDRNLKMLNEALFNQVADRLQQSLLAQQLAVAAEKSTHKPIQPYQLSELQKTMIARLLLRSYGFAIDLTVLFEALELIISYSNPEDSI